MRKTSYALALLAAAALAACGGNGPRSGTQTYATKFTQQVSFGDSLSDVGTYAVGAVAQLGGGTYTINGDNTSINPELTGKNYTVLMAAQLGLPVPCAAQTGLTGDASKGFSVPIVQHTDCFNYAQGGSRVTNPIGPGNGTVLGQTTVPVVTQIANHLSRTGGKFSGTELVTVLAGGNDILALLADLQTAATNAGNQQGQQTFASSLTAQLAAGATNPQAAALAIGQAIQSAAASGASTTVIVGAAVMAAATQPGNSAVASPTVYGPMVTKAQADATAAGTQAGAAYATAHAPDVVAAMAQAGQDLAKLVETQIVAKGANYVVVNNLPDVASTPDGTAQTADIQKLIATAVDAFNSQLKAGVASDPKVLYVDLFSVSHDEVKNPAPYGLTNTTVPACDLTPAKNPFGSSLLCNKNNLIPGDVSHYMFADQIHPTPFEYALIARYILEQMSVKGWL